jgi:hypothetical protein
VDNAIQLAVAVCLVVLLGTALLVTRFLLLALWHSPALLHPCHLSAVVALAAAVVAVA